MEHINVSKIDKKDLKVFQFNNMAVANYFLTLEEKKLMVLLTALVQKDDEDFKTYRIPITDIIDFLEIRGKAFYTRLRETAKTLRSRSLSIEKPNGGWIEAGWISKAEYKKKGEDGLEYACLDLRFDPDLKPYFLHLKSQYYSYMFVNVVNLKSVYSIRFYEIFASYRRLGQVSFDVDDLKKRLQVIDKYSKYNDFRKRVINQAQKELNEKTDICFEYIEERKRRRVERIHFTFQTQTNPQNQKEQTIAQQKVQRIKEASKEIGSLETGDNTEEQDLSFLSTEQEKADQALALNGVDAPARKRLLKKHDPKHIIENSKIVLERYKNEKIGSLAGATVKAVQEGWQPKLAPYEKKEKETKDRLIFAQEKKKAIEHYEQEYGTILEKAIEDIKNTLPSEELKSLKSKSEEEGEKKSKDAKGFGSKEMFARFALNRLLGKKVDIQDRDEWVAKKVEEWEKKKKESY